MTRVLMFDGPKGPRRFEMLYTALLNAGDGKGERTAQAIRKEARLLDQFDAVSVPLNGNALERKLVTDDDRPSQSLTVSQEDFDLLMQYSERAQWTPRVAREAVDLWDWLTAADKQD